VKQNVFSTGSLVLVMVEKKKTKTKQTKNKKTRVRNKKSSGPKRDDADTAASPPSCRSAGFRQVNHRNNGRMETCRIGSEGLEFSEKMALEGRFGGALF